MNPQGQFCSNPYGKARGKAGAGNIHVHSKKERRYFCKRCGKIFSETKHGAAVLLPQEVNRDDHLDGNLDRW